MSPSRTPIFDVIQAAAPVGPGQPYATTDQVAVLIPSDELIPYARSCREIDPDRKIKTVNGPRGAFAVLYDLVDGAPRHHPVPPRCLRRFRIAFFEAGAQVDALDETPERWLINAVLGVAHNTWVAHGHPDGMRSSGWRAGPGGGDDLG